MLSIFGCCCFCSGDSDKEAPDYSPDFDGPIKGKKRCPTDIICLILFLAFIVGMFGIGIYSFVVGHPSRLLHPVDSKGRLCGLDKGVENKPYLLFFDWTRCIQVVGFSDLVTGNVEASDFFSCNTQQVCVDACPTENEAGIRANPVCVDGVDTRQFNVFNNASLLDTPAAADAASTLVQLIIDEKCAPYYIISEELANRCIPTFTELDSFINLANVTNFNESDVPSIRSIIFDLTLSDVLNGTLTQALFLNAQVFVYGVLQDFQVVWPAVLGCAGITVLFCYLYVILMRYFAGIVIIISIILALVLIAAISGFSYFQYYCFVSGNSNIPSITSGLTDSSTVVNFLNSSESFAAAGCQFTNPLRDFFAANAPWYDYQKETWLVIGIVGTLLLLILIIILIVFSKQIRISIAIIQEASKAIGYIPGVIFYPIFTWLFIILTTIFWAAVALFLYTASKSQFILRSNNETFTSITSITNVTYAIGKECVLENFNGVLGSNNTIMIEDITTGLNNTVSCIFNTYVSDEILLYMQLYMLFGLLWVCNYFIALGQCTIAGSFGSYYWAFDKRKDLNWFTTGASFARALFFHTGSLAFGALIIAIIQMIRLILAYIQKKLKKHETSKIAHAILTCMQCCFFLLEKVFKYINRHAYIEIAIYGHDFCTGACKAAKLLLRNVITTAIKDRIVGFLLFMGKLCVVAIMTFIAYLIFGQYEEYGRAIWQRELNYYLIPLIVVMVLSYLIASGFMAVYDMGVDTIFVCALEDQERNNGYDKPYFMSKKLQKLMGVHNRVKRGEGTDGGEIQMEDLENRK